MQAPTLKKHKNLIRARPLRAGLSNLFHVELVDVEDRIIPLKVLAVAHAGTERTNVGFPTSTSVRLACRLLKVEVCQTTKPLGIGASPLAHGAQDTAPRQNKAVAVIDDTVADGIGLAAGVGHFHR